MNEYKYRLEYNEGKRDRKWHIRKGPRKDSECLRKVEHGTELTISEVRADGWLAVSESQGFVKAKAEGIGAWRPRAEGLFSYGDVVRLRHHGTGNVLHSHGLNYGHEGTWVSLGCMNGVLSPSCFYRSCACPLYIT